MVAPSNTDFAELDPAGKVLATDATKLVKSLAQVCGMNSNKLDYTPLNSIERGAMEAMKEPATRLYVAFPPLERFKGSSVRGCWARYVAQVLFVSQLRILRGV